MNRRKLFEWATTTLGAAMTAVISVPLLGYLIAPALRPSPQTEITLLDDVKQLKPGEPLGKDYTVERQDGWILTHEVRRAFIVADAELKITVFSSTCTHAACSVNWKDGKFVCPCHDGQFDIRGRRIGGPPPRPLTKIKNRIVDGQLKIIVEA